MGLKSGQVLGVSVYIPSDQDRAMVPPFVEGADFEEDRLEEVIGQTCSLFGTVAVGFPVKAEDVDAAPLGEGDEIMHRSTPLFCQSEALG